MWISGSIMTIALITGIVIWYRSLALEKPLFHFERPKLPRFSLPRRGLGDYTAELRSAPVEAAPRPAVAPAERPPINIQRSEEHTSEVQSLMRISYAVFCLKKSNTYQNDINSKHIINIITI